MSCRQGYARSLDSREDVRLCLSVSPAEIPEGPSIGCLGIRDETGHLDKFYRTNYFVGTLVFFRSSNGPEGMDSQSVKNNREITVMMAELVTYPLVGESFRVWNASY